MGEYRSGEAAAILKVLILQGFHNGKTGSEVVTSMKDFQTNNLGVDQHAINESVLNFPNYCHDLPRYLEILESIQAEHSDLKSHEIQTQYATMTALQTKDFVKAKAVMQTEIDNDAAFADTKLYCSTMMNILLWEGYDINQEQLDALATKLMSL